MKRIYTSLIEKALKKNRVVLLIGQRQVGKTYELNRFKSQKNAFYIDFEDEIKRNLFQIPSLERLKNIFGKPQEDRFILLDEIQYIPKIGSTLKLLHDHFPNTKIICTGSASFLLLKNIGDSLYGRNEVITMGPLSFPEMLQDFPEKTEQINGYHKIWNQEKINLYRDSVLLYGSLPAIFLEKDETEKQKLLQNYTSSLLFKDIFEIEGIRNTEVFKKCLKLLAFQIGSEINTNELSNTLGVSRNTVLEYIGLYEKFQIIYTLPAYAKNPRKEITKGKKVYFIDLGIRNALIQNFSDLEVRPDQGALFENLITNIFYTKVVNYQKNWNLYFWRNYAKAEVDLLLQTKNYELIPIEIKYTKTKFPTKSFMNTYQEKIIDAFCINRENFWEFI